MIQELEVIEQLLTKRPQDEKLLKQALEIRTKINDTYAEEDAAMRRVNTQRTEFLQEEVDRQKKQYTDLMKAADEEIEINEEKQKKLKAAKAKELKEAHDLHIDNLAGYKKYYADKWKLMVDDEKKTSDFRSEMLKILGIKEKDLGLQKSAALIKQEKDAEYLDNERVKKEKKKEDT